MSSLKLYFGPKNRYFLHDESISLYRFRATPAFLTFFNSANIAEVYHVAFGEDDTYFIAWRTNHGQTFMRYEHAGTHADPYPKLHKFIYDEGPHVVKDFYVSLGMNGSFFAKSDKGQRWHNVPEGAIDYYQLFTTTPLFLTKRVDAIDMCYGDAYIGTTINGDWFWDVRNYYPLFDAEVIKSGKMKQAGFTLLNPFAQDQHFVKFNDGTLHFSFPQEWAVDVAQLMQSYMTQPGNVAGSPQQLPFPPRRYSSTNYFSQRLGSFAGPSSSTSPTFVNPQGAIHLGHSAYDAYSNITNAFNQNQGSGGGGGLSFPDVSQSVDNINNMMNTMGGLNSFAQTALNGGQFTGQIGMMAAGCDVM